MSNTGSVILYFEGTQFSLLSAYEMLGKLEKLPFYRKSDWDFQIFTPCVEKEGGRTLYRKHFGFEFDKDSSPKATEILADIETLFESSGLILLKDKCFVGYNETTETKALNDYTPKGNWKAPLVLSRSGEIFVTLEV